MAENVKNVTKNRHKLLPTIP